MKEETIRQFLQSIGFKYISGTKYEHEHYGKFYFDDSIERSMIVAKIYERAQENKANEIKRALNLPV